MSDVYQDDPSAPETREELLLRLEREQAETRADIARRRAEPRDPDWTRFNGSVAGMTTEEFNLWCVRGKPPLVRSPPKPEPARSGWVPREGVTVSMRDIEVIAEGVGDCLDIERKWTRKHVEREIGLREKAIRDDATNREAVVRRAIDEVTQEVRGVADQLRQEARDGMARNATRLLELRELRETTEIKLWQAVMELQREVFQLRQALAGERDAAISARHLALRPNGHAYD